MAGELHFVLFPFMAQGHMIPMVDFGRVLARRRVIVTLITTPHNASRFETIIHRDRDSLGLRISIIKIQFPWKEAGLPEGTENQDQLPPSVPAMEFMAATTFLQDPVEKLFETLSPPPNCIISDGCLPFTMKIARKFNIPRISFYVFNCFYSLVMHNSHLLLHTQQNEEENFVVPGLPDRIEISKSRAPPPIPQNLEEFQILLGRAEMSSYGIVLNTFEEMEPKYVEALKNKRRRVWCVGPVSLCNAETADKAERGKKSAIDEHSCLTWLDSQKPNSVLYVCFGSLCNLIPSQLIELALGLEASKRPFIWAIRKGQNSEELEKWVSENAFENRIQGRGVLIWGWAPQVLILSHPSVGGFLTHCGANGIQEGICAGVPLMSWPLFSDQFINEQLVLRVLKIGVSAGAKYPVNEGEEEKHGVQVKKEDVKAAIDKLMDEENEEPKDRRRRVKELAEKAKSAVVEGGSSHHNVSLLIKQILEYKKPDIAST
ncbi:UDP-glycosyltransferase 73C5-like isoform X2 [Momordica charantia]|nr:UDP-glycosyltransferase 73C5-like isoform X2 [Momordica charantia]XP_022143978.1 UDP-glycosyltransferase 73C5-like isoform X2 [Momordica charantia]